jgi:hypothetical protein
MINCCIEKKHLREGQSTKTTVTSKEKSVEKKTEYEEEVLLLFFTAVQST